MKNVKANINVRANQKMKATYYSLEVCKKQEKMVCFIPETNTSYSQNLAGTNPGTFFLFQISAKISPNKGEYL